MSSRFLAFALVASLLVFGVSAVALSSSAYAQEDGLWEPGEGVKQDMFVKYRIQEELTNDARPFEMMLYFQEQDQDGNWIVPTFVVDQGKVIKGTIKLADNMAEIAPGIDVPAELNEYIDGYKSSLHWIDGFTKGEPKSLTSASWGPTGSIGASPLIPSGKVTITVPAGTYETTLLLYHKGVDNKIWILDGFPFPIKAETYADVTSGNAPIQFKFDLLETGTGKPEAPGSEEQIPTPPLSKKTGRGTYTIGIDWEPVSINPGSDVIFTVTLQDDTQFPLERANYDFAIKSANGTVIKEFKNQNADAQFGTGTHEVHFDTAGPMTVTVIVNSVSGQTTGQFTESADFNIVVVPEFPISAAIVVAAVIGLVVVMTRARGAGIGSLFGSKGAL